MASVYGYDFNNMSRPSEDLAYLSMRDRGNTGFNSYMTTNYNEGNCQMGRQIAFATRQPAIIYEGCYEGGQGGCLIDVSNKLKIGSTQSNPKERITLQQRPYLTVPYLGRGKYDADAEFALRQGQLSLASERKSISTSADMDILQYKYVPQIPSLRNNIQNSSNIIEESAQSGWIRGGMSTREIPRFADQVNRM